MDPLLQVALATLFTSLGAWINSRVEKRRQSMRPPPRPQQCNKGDCTRSAVWCEVHGHYHPSYGHGLLDPDHERTPRKGTRAR